MVYLLGLSGLLNINNFVLDKFWVSRNCKIMKMKLKFESMYLPLQSQYTNMFIFLFI